MTTERFITGIYNYCDYWCERCAFTRRCRNYASDRAERRQTRPEDVESPADPDADSDATNSAFWDSLAEQLREVAIFGKSEPFAFETPEDIDDADDGPDDDWIAQEAQRSRNVRQHPLMLMAR